MRYAIRQTLTMNNTRENKEKLGHVATKTEGATKHRSWIPYEH